MSPYSAGFNDYLDRTCCNHYPANTAAWRAYWLGWCDAKQAQRQQEVYH